MLGHQNRRASGINRHGNCKYMRISKIFCMAPLLMHTVQIIVTDVDILQ